jgi:hypothetical protein
MATEFLMPKLGLTMESGTIAEWLVPDGDDVTQGSAVLRIETDKTETDVEAPASGRLVPVGQVGDTFDCGQQIGWVLADGEEAPEIAAPAPAAPAPVAAPPAAATAAQPARAATTSTGRLIASPKARQIARDRGPHRLRGPHRGRSNAGCNTIRVRWRHQRSRHRCGSPACRFAWCQPCIGPTRRHRRSGHQRVRGTVRPPPHQPGRCCPCSRDPDTGHPCSTRGGAASPSTPASDERYSDAGHARHDRKANA